MKENEFDIQVRNLLQGAQESVSPSVWEGVAAGLDRRRRVVVFRRWGYIAAAAAAVVAAVVLLWPANPADVEHSNPINYIAEAPAAEEESLPAAQEAAIQEPAAPVVRVAPTRPQRVAQVTPVPEEKVTPAESPAETPVTMPAASEQKKPAAIEQKKPQSSQDQALLNNLAFAESQSQSGSRGVAFSVSGNMQDNRRGSMPANYQRPYAAPLANATEGIYNEDTDSFRLPFSIGLGAKYSFGNRWAVGVGVRYTNLGRSFVGDYVGEGFRFLQTDIDNHQHWLGIPVHGYYEILNEGPWRINGFVGAGVEFLLDNDYLVHGPNKDIHYHAGSARPQWSGDVGVGVEFRITPFLGIYLDPSFRYYFATEWEPRSVRTVQPLRFDVELGLRFSLGK